MIKTGTKRQISVNGFLLSDEAEILAMNLAEYGPRNGIVTPEAFNWRFDNNPAGTAEITTVHDVETGKLAGFTWTLPIRMQLYGKRHLAAMTANQLIHPEYRDTLAYARMSRHRMKWLQQHMIAFRYNFPTEAIYASTGAAEKMSSFLIPLLVRPLDPVRLVQFWFKKGWLGGLLGWLGKLLAPAVFIKYPVLKHFEPLTIAQLDHFDERFDEFWDRVRDKYAVMAIRDQRFLEWRFAPVAGRTYKILAAFSDNKLVGYIVLRTTDEIRGIPIGLVMDFLIEPGLRGEAAGQMLLEEAWKSFQESKVWLAGGLALPHTTEYGAMHNTGYRTLPDKLTPRLFRVAFNCFSDDLPETKQVKEQDLFFTIADYEAH